MKNALCAFGIAVVAFAVPTFAILAITPSANAADLTLLFMGDNGHHRPERRFQELAPALEKRGIELKYTDRMEDLAPETLAQFDGLVLYANIDRIEEDQAKAVLDFVAGGKGFIPLHCATYCWRNNKDIVALMGGQFQRHGGRVFSTQIAQPEHPIMEGYGGFTSWDETYIHHLHNEENRTVLEYREEGEQAEGQEREPWTWVRTHGKGRVFYTAWGHDERTFTQPGFLNLAERGIRWACGDSPGKVPSFHNPDAFRVPQMAKLAEDLKPFEFEDVGPKIPDYTPGRQWGTQRENRNLMQKPLPSEESVKHFVAPEGMAVKTYADERSFQAKPIAMNWDERGRLWICETVDYPNELGGNRDRIRICEDTDGDQVADKFTLFAEGLSVPTAIAIVRGGAVVQNATETLYLKDTDGDDVSDQKITLITGWNSNDTHGGVSNFRYGLDNWIWAMQGYNNSTPHVEGLADQTFRMGFWRFKLSQTDPPTVTDLEFMRSTNNNTWGLGISEEGLIFGSTANRNPSVFMAIPNRYYESVKGWAPPGPGTIADNHLFAPITENVRQMDHHGGYTAGAGHALYTARAFPQQWWNKTAFVCGPTAHLVGTFTLRRDGANYTSTSPCNLIASDDEWTAPVMAEVGPDGAVWVIDWYNYVVQHNPTPKGFKTGKGGAYETDLRDKRHGRIYRVVPNAAPNTVAGTQGATGLHSFRSLANVSNVDLVKGLTHPSMSWRLQAQRLLVERQPDDVLTPLLLLVQDSSVDEIGLNAGAIHALHVLKGIGYLRLNRLHKAFHLERKCLSQALKHPSAGVRRNALVVLPGNEEGLQVLTENAGLLTDEDAQVRLQAMLTLADMPTAVNVGKTIADSASETSDPLLLDALTAAAATHALPYLAALNETNRTVSPANLRMARLVAEHVSRGRPSAMDLSTVVDGLGKGIPPLQVAVLDGLTTGLPTDFKFEATADFDATLIAAFKSLAAAARGKLIRLANQCGTKALDEYAVEIVESLLAQVGDADASDDERVAAARDLVGFRSNDADTVSSIVAQLGAQTTPELGARFLQAVQLSKSPAAGQSIIKAMPVLTPRLKSVAIGTLLSRPDWTKRLLTSFNSRALDINELSLDQKQALRAFPDRQIREQAEKLLSMSGGLPDADREQVLKSLHHLLELEGDVDAGREMFKKHCAACHQHGELGKPIGPNLTGMAVHPKEELLTHIVDPSRSVEGNFRVYTVITVDGVVKNGMLATETRTSITLIDAKGLSSSIQREDVDQLLASRKSLMPEGFEKQMTEIELSNLLQFLTNKGKFLPVPLDRYATAISTKGLFSDGDNGPDRLVFSDWKPKMVGEIPFVLTDPLGKSKPNIILLNGPFGPIPPKMPKSVSLPCNTAAKAIHLLGGVGGWNFPFDSANTVSMIVRLHYADGQSEDHELVNGIHVADYIRRVDVPKSKFAFDLRGQQVRYLAITPGRSEEVTTIELVKGPDNSAPIVMAITIER
jgi:putative membrane-bound dehydrogenase-like protein